MNLQKLDRCPTCGADREHWTLKHLLAPIVWTVADVMWLLGLKAHTVRDLLKCGILAGYKILVRFRWPAPTTMARWEWRIPNSSVTDYLEARLLDHYTRYPPRSAQERKFERARQRAAGVPARTGRLWGKPRVTRDVIEAARARYHRQGESAAGGGGGGGSEEGVGGAADGATASRVAPASGASGGLLGLGES